MAFNNEIEEVKAQIKVLEKKLALLKEMEKTKSPVEEAYKDWWGRYPEIGTWDSFDDTRWQGFQAGYEFAYAISTAKEVMEKVQEEQEVREWDVVRESMNWCKEHPGQNPLDWVKPQTEKEVEEGLRSAMRKAMEDGVFDEKENDKNFKNSLDLIREWGEQNKPKTLYQICMEWWDEVFVNEMDDDICVDVLVSKIDKEFIPPSHDTNDYQWNKCLKIMRDKLR